VDEHAISADNAAMQFYLAGALAMAGTGRRRRGSRPAGRRSPEATPEYLFRLGWVLFRAHRDKEAKRAIADVLARYDTDYSTAGARDIVREARLTLSNLEVQAGHVADAVELLEQVLDEFPDDIGRAQRPGLSLGRPGRASPAGLGDAARAVAAEPENYA